MALTDPDRRRLQAATAVDHASRRPLEKIERGRFRALRVALSGDDADLVDLALGRRPTTQGQGA